jgi:hypothetical protein
MRDINSRAPPDVDVVLCGNKIDVEDKREVSYEEGLNLAEEVRRWREWGGEDEQVKEGRPQA